MSLQKQLSQKIAIIENRVAKDQAELAAYKLVLSAEAPEVMPPVSTAPAVPISVAPGIKRRGRPAASPNKSVEVKSEPTAPIAEAPVSAKPVSASKPAKQGGKRVLSPEARERIAAAQQKRWAKVKRDKKKAAKAATKETTAQFDPEYSQVNGAATHDAA